MSYTWTYESQGCECQACGTQMNPINNRRPILTNFVPFTNVEKAKFNQIVKSGNAILRPQNAKVPWKTVCHAQSYPGVL